MAWQKSPGWLVECFEAALPPGAERRSMFGYPAAFVGGNFAFGLHEHRFVLRVGETDALQLLAHAGQPFSPLPGRVMRGWVVAPDPVVKDAHELRRWVLRAMTHAASLPPKGSAASPKAGASGKAKASGAPRRGRRTQASGTPKPTRKVKAKGRAKKAVRTKH